ncbi:MAG: histidinol-phosphate transaminase [Candidatus Sumerlaeaceae bacterium]
MKIAVNPAVAELHAYVPGEQPREPGFVKLNTNESPYPPAPEVLESVASTASYNKYPDPLSTDLRTTIAADLGLAPSNVLIGNGSDEVLRLLCHAFLDAAAGDSIGMLNPTYVLYETLAAMFGVPASVFDLTGPDYALPTAAISSDVKLFFLPNPNPPIGTWYTTEQIRALADFRSSRLIVVDEAYVDFAPGSAVELLRQYENLVITRTFSKSYSLAGLRVGFVLASEQIIEQLNKIRDSYNVNRVSQSAALAAWQATAYYAEMTKRIRTDRDCLRQELLNRGFTVPLSHGNFLFARDSAAADLYSQLKARKVLVRYFNTPALADGIRITVGTRNELEILLRELDAIRSLP